MSRHKKVQKVQKEKRKRGRPPKNKNLRGAAAGIPDSASSSQNMLGVHAGTQNASPRHSSLKDAPQENYFILCNGKPVKNMKELADIMEELEEHIFNYHVNPDKNDFSNWIKDIFKDLELAEKLAGMKDKHKMQLVIYKHITHKLW